MAEKMQLVGPDNVALSGLLASAAKEEGDEPPIPAFERIGEGGICDANVTPYMYKVEDAYPKTDDDAKSVYSSEGTPQAYRPQSKCTANSQAPSVGPVGNLSFRDALAQLQAAHERELADARGLPRLSQLKPAERAAVRGGFKRPVLAIGQQVVSGANGRRPPPLQQPSTAGSQQGIPSLPSPRTSTKENAPTKRPSFRHQEWVTRASPTGLDAGNWSDDSEKTWSYRAGDDILSPGIDMTNDTSWYKSISDPRTLRLAMNKQDSQRQAGRLRNSIGNRGNSFQQRTWWESVKYNTKRYTSVKWLMSRKSPFDARDLDFIQLCAQKRGPHVNWHELPGKERAEIIRQALKRQWLLLDPDTSYLKCWDMVLVICLIFTAIVTPFELAFIQSSSPQFLVTINFLVDFVFLKDICLQFVMKVKIHNKQGTTWIRDHRQIAKKYLKSWFAVDVLSITPFDELAGYAQAGTVGDLTLVRMLKVCRLAKLARILKGAKIVKRWENRIGLPTSNTHFLFFAVLVITACHWMACVWGFVGMSNADNLECRHRVQSEPDYQPFGDWLDFPERAYYIRNQETLDPWSPSLWDGESWVVSFARNRLSSTPADPCDLWTVYSAAMYWAVMTLTSIGYGDIVPTTRTEYVICSLCMLGSSVLWAYIIGAACAITSNMDPEQKEFEQRLDAFNAMARDEGLPDEMRYRCREFIREERFHQHFLRNRAAVNYLGDNLRGVISNKLAGHYFRNIWFFQRCSSQFQESTAEKVIPHFYERRTVIEQFGQLCVVERGAVGRSGRIYLPLKYWGEDMLIRLSILRARIPAITLSYSEIVTLSREDLTLVLDNFPEELLSFRRAAALLALTKVVRIYCSIKQGRKEAHMPHFAWIGKVFDAMPDDSGNSYFTGSINLQAVDDGDSRQFGEVLPPVTERLDSIQQSLDRLEGNTGSRSVERLQTRKNSEVLRYSLMSRGMSRGPS